MSVERDAAVQVRTMLKETFNTLADTVLLPDEMLISDEMLEIMSSSFANLSEQLRRAKEHLQNERDVV